MNCSAAFGEDFAIPMTYCSQRVDDCICTASQGDLWLTSTIWGIDLLLIFQCFYYGWEAHKRNFRDAIAKPKNLKSAVFLIYCTAVPLMVVFYITLVLEAYRVLDNSPYFNLWVLCYMLPFSLYTSVISLLCSRLVEIARNANKLDAAGRSIFEYILIVYAFVGPVIYGINMANAQGQAFGMWTIYTYQFQVETIICTGIWLTSVYYVKKSQLDDKKEIKRTIRRLRNMMMVCWYMTLTNVAQNVLHLVVFPFWVWSLHELGFIITIQDAAWVGRDQQSKISLETMATARTTGPSVNTMKTTSVRVTTK